jgi:RecA/RadA recombinase
MANLARADLEALLRSRQLDRTLTSALPLSDPGGGSGVLPTGLASLDRILEGGVPRGALSEIAGARSSGRTSVLLALLASAIGSGELAALVDPLDRLDPTSAAAAGVETSRVLWVRGEH